MAEEFVQGVSPAQPDSTVSGRPAAPAPAPAPDTPESLAAKQAEAQRLADTQRWGHQKAQEAAKLKSTLDQIYAHPQLGPLAREAAGIPQPGNLKEQIQAVKKAYQEAPDNDTAVETLIERTHKLAEENIMARLQQREFERGNFVRVQRRDSLVAQAINNTVTETAPDVPLQLFWAVSQDAEAETPASLTTLPERLQWQVGRAIDMARGVLGDRTRSAVETARQADLIARSAGPIMAGGGAGRPGGGGTPSAPPKSFLEQIKAAQDRTR